MGWTSSQNWLSTPSWKLKGRICSRKVLGCNHWVFIRDVGEIQIWCQIIPEGNSITSFLQVSHWPGKKEGPVEL